MEAAAALCAQVICHQREYIGGIKEEGVIRLYEFDYLT